MSVIFRPKVFVSLGTLIFNNLIMRLKVLIPFLFFAFQLNAQSDWNAIKNQLSTSTELSTAQKANIESAR
ncbi:MAG: hypothetical protein RL226_1526, partial [Bacteroidota bacterium]